MEKIMGEIMQEHVDRLMMLGTLSADEFTELLRYRNAETDILWCARQRRFR